MSIEIIQCNSLEWLQRAAIETPARFDLIVTDPPYDSLTKWAGVGTTARMGFGRGRDAAASDKFYPTIDRDDMWQVLMALDNLAKENSYTYIMADGEYMPVLLAWVRESGELSWNYSKPLVWDKINAGMGYHWRSTHEYIVMFQKGRKRLNDLGKQDVFRYKRVTGGYPTEKPFQLFEDLILNSTQPGDWVLDPFCGSGVTAAVCQKHGRNCVTLDISPRATEWAQRRLEQPASAPGPVAAIASRPVKLKAPEIARQSEQPALL